MPELDDLTELQVDSDSALFDGAIAETPETPDVSHETPEIETPAVTDEQPRDESGRFAAKPGDTPAEVVTPAVATTPTEPEGGQIPAWRLREEADNRRRVETELAERNRELAELRRNPPKPAEPAKPETKPDPLLDPDGYEAYLERKVEARFAAAEQARIKERGEESLQAARTANTELFDKAYAEVQRLRDAGDTHSIARIRDSRDPGKELLKWYREREAVREVGDDPNAWFERKFEEALKDPAKAAKAISILRAQQNPASVPAGTRNPSPVRLPPSLSTVTPSGSAIGAGDDDVSDEGLFRHATAGIGR